MVCEKSLAHVFSSKNKKTYFDEVWRFSSQEGDVRREKRGATIDQVAAPFALYLCSIASKSPFGRLYGHYDLPAGRSQ